MAQRRATPEPAQTVVKVGSDYCVLASSLASRRASQVLADGRSFAVFETAGDIIDSPLEAQGFFESDTRHLSRFEMLIAGAAPYFLNSYLSDDRAQFRATLTNADLGKKGQPDWLPRNSVGLERAHMVNGASTRRRLSEPALYQPVTLHNYVDTAVIAEIDFSDHVDFAGGPEVRGLRRTRRGVS